MAGRLSLDTSFLIDLQRERLATADASAFGGVDGLEVLIYR